MTAITIRRLTTSPAWNDNRSIQTVHPVPTCDQSPAGSSCWNGSGPASAWCLIASRLSLVSTCIGGMLPCARLTMPAKRTHRQASAHRWPSGAKRHIGPTGPVRRGGLQTWHCLGRPGAGFVQTGGLVD